MARFSKKGKVDPHDVRELQLWIDNDETLYNRKMAMFRNLAQKKKRGVYDSDRAPQLFRYLISDALKQYIREINPDRNEWPFSPASQNQAAKEMVEEFEAEYKLRPQNFVSGETAGTGEDQGVGKPKKNPRVAGKKKRKRSTGGVSGKGKGSEMAGKKKAKKKASVGAKKKASVGAKKKASVGARTSVGASKRRRPASAKARFEIQVRERKESVLATGKGTRIYDAYVIRDGSRIELPAIIAKNQAQARAIAKARIRKDIG